MYGFYYASLALEEKFPVEQQRELYPSLARGVLYCRQPDGSFWDYPLYNYHYHYGTAFSLLALSRAPAGWLDTPIVAPASGAATTPAGGAAAVATPESSPPTKALSTTSSGS